MPAISIIVPVYNTSKLLDKCITSILIQSFKDFELILINDGSNDNSGNICEVYAKRDNRVKVIHQSNKGQATARNTGLKIACGDFVGFVDSDDWIESDMYKILYNSCIDNDSDISIIGIREVNEDGKCVSEYIPNNVTFSEILRRAYPVNKIFKRQLFTNNNLFFSDGKYYEDLELIPKIFSKCDKFTEINKISYNYLKRIGSTTNSRDAKILDNIWAYTEIKKYLIDQNLYLNFGEEFEKGVIYFKKYYINVLYDYPSIFLFKNCNRIIKDFNKIGGLKKSDYLSFIFKHLNFTVRRLAAICKNKVGRS